MLVGAGQLIEQRGLSAVLVPGKREGERSPFRKRDSVMHRVISAGFHQLADSRVRSAAAPGADYRRLYRLGMYLLDGYFPCLLQAESQLISPQLKLHRVPHRGNFLQRYFRLGSQSHIEKVVPERAGSADGAYIRALSRL